MNDASATPDQEPIDARPASASLAPAPFPLTADDVEEFRAIMAEETGTTMNDQEAWNRAIELTSLYRMLIGPIPEDPGD